MSYRTLNASGAWPAPMGGPSEPDEPEQLASVVMPATFSGMPVSAPGITRLAHCLGGQLDDGGSGKAAGRAGGEDWREHPSRQGNWLVYRDGRRVPFNACTSGPYNSTTERTTCDASA